MPTLPVVCYPNLGQISGYEGGILLWQTPILPPLSPSGPQPVSPIHACPSHYSPSELCVGCCFYPGNNLLLSAQGLCSHCLLPGNLSSMTLPYYPAGVPHHWGAEIPTVDITVHSAEVTYVVLGVPKGDLGWEF